MKQMKRDCDHMTLTQSKQSVPKSESIRIVQPEEKAESTKRQRNLKRLCALGIISLVTAGVGMALENRWNRYPPTQTETSVRLQGKSKGNSKIRQRTIIFVGGKKARRGAVKNQIRRRRER
jgi:hypothetical protein